MLRLEVLDQNERVVSVHKLDQGLTILGRSPGADVHLTGEGVGPMHVGIKVGKKPVIMDLGGPSALRLNGKEIVEHELDFDGKAASAMLEIGARKVRLARTATVLQDPRRVPWAPVSDGKSKALNIRVRLYVNGRAVDVVNTRTSFKVGMGCGVGQDIDVVWFKNKEAHARVPREWLVLGGRIQIGSGKDARIEKLDAWAVDTRLETGVVYRILAGPYALEILVSEGALIIGGARPNPFPAELRKPFAVSTAVVAAVFALWMLLFGRPDAKVEEPYPVYARIQNIPVEKIPEPEQTAAADLPQAGGGSGSDSKENTAPTVGAAASAPVSKLAAALTGGLKNLVGSVVSQSKNSGAVMSETGVGVAAAAGAPGPAVGRLAAVGGGATGAAGAAKL
ncbi:MAG: hypothetical protein HY075_05540, partial [Deltaproteobacteria bacterium]|nr:hypothetical protein [Deltaproteobacteria bacterium]